MSNLKHGVRILKPQTKRARAIQVQYDSEPVAIVLKEVSCAIFVVEEFNGLDWKVSSLKLAQIAQFYFDFDFEKDLF